MSYHTILCDTFDFCAGKHHNFVTLDNFALDQTSLDKKQSSRLHSTRWPNALDISLNMHVERCIVKSRERLAWALESD